MSRNPLVQLSKLLSLMLRHAPHEFDLVLDAEGFAPLEDVVRAARSRLATISEADIVRVVETIEPDKQRFSIVDGDIRANYGHSLRERIVHSAAQPPELLFHGTHEAAAPIVLREGLAPMKRQYVHLTPNRDLATRVGGRRGKPVFLDVSAGAAHRDGHKFYRANESFWLADSVPAHYLARAKFSQ
jgi:putative RNA 2'-phosphotransferase